MLSINEQATLSTPKRKAVSLQVTFSISTAFSDNNIETAVKDAITKCLPGVGWIKVDNDA